jgi:tRNA uridine 5-carboxymethylaminomethyl modification enzyme
MFTSRAEYRLLLRQDNADLRLSPLAHEIGLLPERNFQKLEAKRTAIDAELVRLENSRVGPNTLTQLLRRPEMTYDQLPDQNPSLTPEAIEQVEIFIKYEGYIVRQEIEVGKLKSLEDKQIPNWMDYAKVPSLRTEARQKLAKIQPSTLGQASRISGVSPSDIGILMIWLKQGVPTNGGQECTANEE